MNRTYVESVEKVNVYSTMHEQLHYFEPWSS